MKACITYAKQELLMSMLPFDLNKHIRLIVVVLQMSLKKQGCPTLYLSFLGSEGLAMTGNTHLTKTIRVPKLSNMC